jgi:hypothetical protein
LSSSCCCGTVDDTVVYCADVEATVDADFTVVDFPGVLASVSAVADAPPSVNVSFAIC